MSENKTSNDAGPAGSSAGTHAGEPCRSGADSAASGVSQDGAQQRPAAASTAGAASQANRTAPPEAAVQASAPGPKASASERASTDAPSSASNVEPLYPPQARRDDTRESAQDATVRAKAPPSVDAKTSLAENLEAATEAEAAIAGTQTVIEEPATVSPAPKGFTPEISTAADFGALNPPQMPPHQQQAGAQAQHAYMKQSDSAWSVFGSVITARARQIFDRAGQRMTQRTLRIGVSARIFHPEPGAKGLRGKTLQYLEESIAHWVMSRDVLVFMIPTVGHQGMLHTSNIRLRDYAKHLDGLLLQGGADVSPQSYEEVTTRPEWPGDRVRDMYELELLHEFIESGKPVLGVCRGCQLINVAFGGTLYGDIATDVPTAGIHVNEQYDQHRHSIRFPDGSTLVNMFPNQRDALVNSIHHQAVRTLGRDLNIEAVSAEDGIIEAVRYRKAPFVVGVQWHPEFHRAGGDELLDCTPLLDTFLRVARETRF
ncbi:Para-aminobenzoate synthase, amidotransferase component [Candidatus Burkholderia brachyanthoides]|nr:Para-aminobenzoate synthase, amidotransferase component [Candidatus Burkholderia brachyanthoides]